MARAGREFAAGLFRVTRASMIRGTQDTNHIFTDLELWRSVGESAPKRPGPFSQGTFSFQPEKFTDTFCKPHA